MEEGGREIASNLVHLSQNNFLNNIMIYDAICMKCYLMSLFLMFENGTCGSIGLFAFLTILVSKYYWNYRILHGKQGKGLIWLTNTVLIPEQIHTFSFVLEYTKYIEKDIV